MNNGTVGLVHFNGACVHCYPLKSGLKTRLQLPSTKKLWHSQIIFASLPAFLSATPHSARMRIGKQPEPPPPPPQHPKEIYLDEKWDKLLDLSCVCLLLSLRHTLLPMACS